MDMAEILDEHSRRDYAPKPRRRERGLLITAIALAAALVGGGVYSAITIRDLNAQVAAHSAQDAEDRAAADAAAADAALSAQLAADSAQAAQEATDSLIAEEEAAAAAKAAEEAAAAAEAAEKANSGAGSGGPVRCPAGSSANSSDGVNDTSCFPDVCFTVTVPDPAHPECNTAFKP